MLSGGGKGDDIGRSIHDAAHALTEGVATKIHKQPEGLLGETDIGEKLFGVDWSEPLDRFHFNDKLAVDEQIHAIAFGEFQSVKFEREELIAAHAPNPERLSRSAKSIS